MNEKRYLKWYNKIGYGSGDIAGNAFFRNAIADLYPERLLDGIIDTERFARLPHRILEEYRRYSHQTAPLQELLHAQYHLMYR